MMAAMAMPDSKLGRNSFGPLLALTQRLDEGVASTRGYCATIQAASQEFVGQDVALRLQLWRWDLLD